MGQYFWPAGVPRRLTIEAFVEAYALLGYAKCGDGSLEPGFEKIAIYSKGLPTHAARQLSDGRWTSKLGQSEDISHDAVETVEGPLYGTVEVYMKRPQSACV